MAKAKAAKSISMERNLTLEAVRVTEAAAIAAAGLIGLGDEQAADEAASAAMLKALEAVNIAGKVVIGLGERDDVPRLFVGQEVGSGKGPAIDIALDPLEGTSNAAKGAPNAMAVIAFANAGCFLHAPDIYMDKIAVGAGLPPGVVDLDRSPAENLKSLAAAKNVAVSDLTVCILDRPRHMELINAVRATGARVALISDGDIAGVIATTDSDTGIDIYMGSGGAPEGVLAAAALRCIGGQMQGRLIFRNEDERSRARRLGIEKLDRKYEITDLASGDVIFAATGVTDGSLLSGVKRAAVGHKVHSVSMRSETRTIRRIEAVILHALD